MMINRYADEAKLNSLRGTVNLSGRGQRVWRDCVGKIYTVSAKVEISAQTRNVCFLAALCSAAVM